MQVDEQSEKQAETGIEVGNIENPPTASPQNTQPNTMKNVLEPKRSNKFLIPAIALALALLGVSIWFVLGRSNNPSSTTSTPANNATNKEQSRAISALGRLEPQGEVIKVASPSALGTSRII